MCTACTGGKYTSGTATTGANEAAACTTCATGYGGDATSGGCTQCVDGSTFKSFVGNTICFICGDNVGNCTASSPGTCLSGYGGDPASGCSLSTSSVGDDCSSNVNICNTAGQFCDVSDLVGGGSNTCQLAQTSFYATGDGNQISCDTQASNCGEGSAGSCDAGYYGNAADASCILCTQGKYKSTSGNGLVSNVCKICDPHIVTGTCTSINAGICDVGYTGNPDVTAGGSGCFEVPTGQPSVRRTSQPSGSPTAQPTRVPSMQPTGQPTSAPTSTPSYSFYVEALFVHKLTFITKLTPIEFLNNIDIINKFKNTVANKAHISFEKIDIISVSTKSRRSLRHKMNDVFIDMNSNTDEATRRNLQEDGLLVDYSTLVLVQDDKAEHVEMHYNTTVNALNSDTFVSDLGDALNTELPIEKQIDSVIGAEFERYNHEETSLFYIHTPQPSVSPTKTPLSIKTDYFISFMCLIFVVIIVIEYLLHGRYHRVAFLRQERVTNRLVTATKQLASQIYYYSLIVEADHIKSNR